MPVLRSSVLSESLIVLIAMSILRTGYSRWESDFLGAIAPQGGGTTTAAPAMDFGTFGGVEYGRKNPFPAEVTESVILNGEGNR